jgi:hypothetical protein
MYACLTSHGIDGVGGFAYNVVSVAAVFPALFLNDSAKRKAELK